MITLASFAMFLLAFTAIGVASASRARSGTDDYLVAGRSVNPWLTALSSVATNNSGFMFVGLIGFTYRDGLHTVWMAIGWILGDLLVWLGVHRRVRELSGQHDLLTVPELVGTSPEGHEQRPLVVAAGVLTFVFLGGYAAAQLDAGSVALTTLFGLPSWAGAVIGTVIVTLYCLSGGLRASIWTDAAQAVVMLGSMVVLLGYAVVELGGLTVLWTRLHELDPALVRLLPPHAGAAFPLYFLSFIAGGFGAVGQPHILIRSMAIESPAAIARARTWYYAWFVPFYAAAILIALYARALMPELAGASDVVSASEGALPALAVALMPQVFVGLMLAGLFSATMSTADSQILACSAAVTQDVFPALRSSNLAPKVATLAVAAVALGMALWADDGVFALVLGAWSMLGATLGPLVLLRTLGKPISTPVGLAMMATGLLVTWAWGLTPWAGVMFKLLPGMLAPLLLYGMWRLLSR